MAGLGFVQLLTGGLWVRAFLFSGLNVSMPVSFLFSGPGHDPTSQHNRKPVRRLAQWIIGQVCIPRRRLRLGVSQKHSFASHLVSSGVSLPIVGKHLPPSSLPPWGRSFLCNLVARGLRILP